MGEMYFYGKIVSFFFQNGSNCLKGKEGMARMAQIMMMSQAAKAFTGNSKDNNSLASMIPLMMLSGGNNPFSNMFGFFNNKDEKEAEPETKEDATVKQLLTSINDLVSEIKSLKEIQIKQSEEIAALKQNAK